MGFMMYLYVGFILVGIHSFQFLIDCVVLCFFALASLGFLYLKNWSGSR